MRFMFIVKSAQMMPPPQLLAEAIGKLAEREIKAGRLVDMGGLMPPAMGSQVRIAGGKIGVTDGPFVETKEIVGGYAIFELPGKDEALAAALEFMELHRAFAPGWEGICEVRQMA
jgi:hypothetical protein